MDKSSKTTLAISYNHVVHGFSCPVKPGLPEYYNFTEGVWNEPPLPYGDTVLLKGKLETVEAVKQFVAGIDRRIDQALIYAGSLKPERHSWLMEAVQAVRANNPACELLVFVCDCARHEPIAVRHLMHATNTGVSQWFEQTHIGGDPRFNGAAPNIGNNPMWYTLMVCRRYGQDEIKPASHLHRLRTNPPHDEPGMSQVLGEWLMQI